MWTRQEVKERGKAAFQRNYWKTVIAAVVLMAVSGGVGASGGSDSSSFSEMMQGLRASSGFPPFVLVGVLLAVAGIGLIVKLAVYVVLTLPLTYGVKKFFLKNAEGEADLKELTSGYQKDQYVKVVGTQLIGDIFIAIGLLLLFVPGIILMYQYRLVTYLMAEEGLSGMECLRRSKEMMAGHKMEAFKLDLSFIGWFILSAITLGIVGIFYVNPYKEATNAELYRIIRDYHYKRYQ